MRIEIKDGVVTNDGDEIGIIQGAICYLTEKVGPTVKGAIRKESGNAELAFNVGDAPDTEDVPPDPPSVTITATSLSDDDLAAEMKRRGLIQDAPEIVQVAADPVPSNHRGIARLMEAVDAGTIPPPPTQHLAMGDKDPAFVAWFRQHATADEFAAKYAHRKLPSHDEFKHAESAQFGVLPNEKPDSGN